MIDRTQDWDQAIADYHRTGEISPLGMSLALNSCPTCCDTGMDEGLFCADCPTGRRLSRQGRPTPKDPTNADT